MSRSFHTSDAILHCPFCTPTVPCQQHTSQAIADCPYCTQAESPCKWDSKSKIPSPLSYYSGCAWAVNVFGDIVGETYDPVTMKDEPYLWGEATRGRGRLNDLLPDSAPWELLTARGINSSGNIFGLGKRLVGVDENGCPIPEIGWYLLRSGAKVDPDLADTEPPQITPPDDQIVFTHNPNGEVYCYATPYVTDNDRQQLPDVQFSQASGTLFPVGTTIVNVTAKDEAGNVSAASFKIEVVYLQLSAPNLPDNQKLDPGLIMQINDEYIEGNTDGAATNPKLLPDNADSDMLNTEGVVVAGERMISLQLGCGLPPEVMGKALVRLEQVGTGRARVFMSDGVGPGKIAQEILASNQSFSADLSSYFKANAPSNVSLSDRVVHMCCTCA
ncbi:MAG: HYR domain-containing protein [Planctomycetota bacterium]